MLLCGVVVVVVVVVVLRCVVLSSHVIFDAEFLKFCRDGLVVFVLELLYGCGCAFFVIC